MEHISYARASVTCMPIIGPLASIYNSLEIAKEISKNPRNSAISATKMVLIRAQLSLSSMLGDKKAMQEGIKTFSAQQTEFKDSFFLIHQKGRVYAICGIIGNILSTALIATLTALKIFSGAHSIIWGASFTAQAAVLSYNLYWHHKAINGL